MFPSEEEICNIWFQRCKPVLNRGEKWCPKCEGAGAGFVNISFKQRVIALHRCPLCEGEGKVDWIKAITKKSTMKDTILPRNMKEIRLKCPGHLNCKKKLKRLWQRTKKFSKNPFYNDVLSPY